MKGATVLSERTYRPADTLHRVKLKLNAGGWVQVCRQNAEALLKLRPGWEQPADLEIQYKRRGVWYPFDLSIDHVPRTQYRARTWSPA